MQNKVGDRIPTSKQIEKLVADVRALEESVKAFTVTLSSAERLSTVKMRTGGESIVPTIAKLVEQHKIALPEITVERMTADLELAQLLQPLAEAVAQLGQRLNDTILEAQSECWWAATAYYTALSRMTGANPALEAALKPVVSFFALGRRKKAPAASPAPAPRTG